MCNLAHHLTGLYTAALALAIMAGGLLMMLAPERGKVVLKNAGISALIFIAASLLLQAVLCSSPFNFK